MEKAGTPPGAEVIQPGRELELGSSSARELRGPRQISS